MHVVKIFFKVTAATCVKLRDRTFRMQIPIFHKHLSISTSIPISNES